MARRRLQQRGDLYQQSGWWKLRWRVDAIDVEGRLRRIWSKPVTIGPAMRMEGMPALTEKEAKRLAWDNHLSRLDQNQQTPLSMMTVAQFVERKFLPGHVRHLKKAGRVHYDSMLKRVLPAIGKMRLCDVRKEHVQALVNGVLDSGRSWQTALHVKNAVSGVFTYAGDEGCFSGRNPARGVNLGERRLKRTPRALTFDEARRLLDAVAPDLRSFCEFLLYTSCNVSEAVGLRWRYVNLSDEWGEVDGEALPPKHIAIRHQLFLGEFGSVKARPRVRNIPLSAALLSILSGLRARVHHVGPEDWVFINAAGGPFDEHNQVRRNLKLHAALVGLGSVERDADGNMVKFSSWVAWHTFRHTHSTWTKAVGLSDHDRMKLMGHAALSMTDRYTHEDTERQRDALDRISVRLAGEPPEPRGANVVEIKRRAG